MKPADLFGMLIAIGVLAAIGLIFNGIDCLITWSFRLFERRKDLARRLFHRD